MTNALTFGPLPATDQPAPTTADIRSELTAHPGQWAVVYRADRMARAETFRDAVNDGRKFGPNMRAQVRKLGAECRVFVSYSGS
jgi:hypothetical protein